MTFPATSERSTWLSIRGEPNVTQRSIHEFGGPEVLKIEDVVVPEPVPRKSAYG